MQKKKYRKRILILLLLSIIIIAVSNYLSLKFGYLINPKAYLPIYEYNNAIDGSINYENIVTHAHGIVIYKLSKTIPCDYDICYWVDINHSTGYNSNWIMYDGTDPNDSTKKGGYYFYDWEKEKKVEGPFDRIQLEEPSGDWALRKVLVVKDNKYGLYDILSKKFVLPLESDMAFFMNDHHIVYENNNSKYELYEIYGKSVQLIKEYDTLDDFYKEYIDENATDFIE